MDDLLALSRSLAIARSPGEVARVAAAAAAKIFAAEVAGILAVDDGVLRPLHTADPRGGESAFREYRTGLEGRSLFALAVRKGGVVRSRDLLKDPRVGRKAAELLGIRAVTAAPLPGARDALGVLFLGGRIPGDPPADADGETLEAVAAQTATALERSRLLSAVRETSRAADAQARQLRDRSEELERLIFLLSHDLRTPVVSIQNFLHYLETEVEDDLPEEARFYLERIGANCEHLNNLIRGILDLTQVGREAEARERVDLADVVAEVLASLDPDARRTEAAIDVDGLPAVTGDRTRLFQVFQNLLGNALAHGSEGGDEPLEIRIWSEGDGDEATVFVWNSGPPVPEEAKEEIFELFRRLPSAVDRHPAGTGAGLAIVKRIVSAHGGEVGVRTVEGGPAFWITLPRWGEGAGP